MAHRPALHPGGGGRRHLISEEDLSKETLRWVLPVIRRRRGELRAAAAPLGRRIFAEKPKPLVKRFGELWQAARDAA